MRKMSLLNDEMSAPILRPATFVVLVAQRQFLAVADRRDAISSNPQRFEVLFGGLCAFGAQRDVELFRATLIAMAFDLNSGALVPLLSEPSRVGSQDFAILGSDCEFVQIEMDVGKRTAVGAEPSLLPVFERRTTF